MSDTVTREELQAEIKKLQIQIRTNEASNDPRNYGHKNKQHKREIAVRTLALRGLDVQPRPIEEAPRDGTKIWAFWGGEWVKTYWAKRDKFEGWQMPQGMVIKAFKPETWKPTHFSPVSSLPTPKDVT